MLKMILILARIAVVALCVYLIVLCVKKLKGGK